MNDEITLTLNRQELNQLLEGLSEQAEAWERTRETLHALPSVVSLDSTSSFPLKRRSRFAGMGGQQEAVPEAVKIADRSNRLERYEFALACAAMDRMAARYRDIMDKILEQLI